MRVSNVLDPASNAVSFTLISVTGVVEPAERHLRYLAETERSPNTIKAHANDMKDWFLTGPASSLQLLLMGHIDEDMDSRGGFARGPLGFLAVVIKVAEVAAKAGIRIR